MKAQFVLDDIFGQDPMLNILFKEFSNTEKFYSINYSIRVVSTLYTLYTLCNLKGMLNYEIQRK